VAIAPGGLRLASASEDGTVQLWDTATNDTVGPLLAGDLVAFSADGTRLVSAGADGKIRISNARTGDLTDEEATGEAITALSVDPDGLVGTASWNGTGRSIVTSWNPRTGNSVGSITIGSSRPVRSMSYSPDGALLATGADDGRVQLFDPDTGNQVADTLTNDGRPILAVVFGPEGQLASTPLGGPIHLWGALAETHDSCRIVEDKLTYAQISPYLPKGWDTVCEYRDSVSRSDVAKEESEGNREAMSGTE